MFLYPGTGSGVLKRAFTTSTRVYEKAQKNLDESTHTICGNRLMHMVINMSSYTNGMTYVKAPTWDGQRVPWW